MDSHNEDIRKAFERLQRTIGIVADRTRGLQRERKLLLERIDELEEAYLTVDAAAAERSDEALKGRARSAELEEQVFRLQRDQEALHEKIARLEAELKEREGFIAEQEDRLVQAQQQIEEFESGRSVATELQDRITALESELEIAQQRVSTQEQEWQQNVGDLESQYKGQLSEKQSEIEQERQRSEERAAEWERRIAEAESGREETRETVDDLIRERDQARATVESMLVRVRQLEAGDNEQSTQLQEKVESLTQDLEEALEMASNKEAEVEELRGRLTMLEENLSNTNGNIVFDEEEQGELVSQVEAALTLIDKYLGERA